MQRCGGAEVKEHNDYYIQSGALISALSIPLHLRSPAPLHPRPLPLGIIDPVRGLCENTAAARSDSRSHRPLAVAFAATPGSGAVK